MASAEELSCTRSSGQYVKGSLVVATYKRHGSQSSTSSILGTDYWGYFRTGANLSCSSYINPSFGLAPILTTYSRHEWYQILDRLKELELSSLQRRRERYKIIHLWKVHQEICPNVIGIQFKENTRLSTKAVLPSLKKKAPAAAVSSYDNSFAVRAVKL